MLQYSVSCQQEVQKAKQKANFLKKIQCHELIRPVRVYREDSSLHVLYQYYEQSLEEYLKQFIGTAKSDHIQNIKNIKMGINSCITHLINRRIRADLYLSDMAVDKKGDLKIFVHPQLQLVQDFDQLTEFYQTEEKRISVEIQQIYQKYHGKILKKEDKGTIKSPNFFINGNQLVFVNGQESNTNGNINLKKQAGRIPEQVRNRKGSNANYSKLPSIFNPFGMSQHTENIEMSNSGGGRADQIIKKSRQLKDKVQGLISKQKNEMVPLYAQRLHEIQCQNTQQTKMQNSMQDRKINAFNMSGSGHNNSRTDDSEQRSYMKMNNSNYQHENGIASGSKKMKMRITTCHEIQVEAKDLERVRRQIINQQNGFNDFISKGLACDTNFGENELIASQVTNQCNYHQKNSLSPQRSTNVLADRAKLLKEKAGKLLAKRQ